LRITSRFVLCGGLALVLAGVSSCKQRPNAPQASQQTAQLASQQTTQPVSQQKAQIPSDADQERSCREFVQGFYDWYIAKETSSEGSGSTDDDVLRFKPKVLSSKLRRMLIEEYAADAKMNGDLDLQLDFDPYINAQDNAVKVAVRKVTYHDGKCRASVWLVPPVANYDLVNPELTFENGTWVFINFHYPDPETPSDENLIDMLIMLPKKRALEKAKDAQP